MKLIYRLIGTFFGIGYVPIAPGTAASFFTALLFKLYFYRLDWPLYLGVAVVIYAAGVWASTRYTREMRVEDPRTMVIDEVLGQWLALFLLPPSWSLIILAFILFRIFDVLKPLFIRRAESFSEGWGIMLDDVLAGIYTSILINIYILIR
jgi:phosphatidylglycerophosphatase A